MRPEATRTLLIRPPWEESVPCSEQTVDPCRLGIWVAPVPGASQRGATGSADD